MLVPSSTPARLRERPVSGARRLALAMTVGLALVAPEASAAEPGASRSDVTFEEEENAPEGEGSTSEPAVEGGAAREASAADDGPTDDELETSKSASNDAAPNRGPTTDVASGSVTATPRARARRGRPPRRRPDGPLWRYLERPVRPGPHYVDHGVLQVGVAGGWPHLYRLELALGVLDHFTVGATTHWLPGQPRPKITPVVAVAFFRNHLFETGLRHFWSMYPPPVQDFDPATPSFPRSAQWLLAHASFGQALVTGGFDAGVVRARDNDPGQDPDEQGNNPSIIRWRFGGGLHLRVGTRRWGFTAQVLVPHVLAELRLDLRFGLFERRPRGGWRPRGIVEDWDRPAPW